MITYIDTSTLLKLIVEEVGSDRAETLWRTADSLASVTLIAVEARAALAAARRGHRLSPVQYSAARIGLDALLEQLFLVEPTRELVDAAGELAETESLRGYDAVHLAAALRIGATVFSSADTRLCDAAEGRGLHVANPVPE